MKYLVLIALTITLSVSVSANVMRQISMAQQTAQMQAAKLRIDLELSDKQTIQAYGIIFKAASKIIEYKSKNDADFKSKLMEVQFNSSKEFKNFLSQEQMQKYYEIMADTNQKNSSIFYSN